jgi:hypothetical protein
MSVAKTADLFYVYFECSVRSLFCQVRTLHDLGSIVDASRRLWGDQCPTGVYQEIRTKDHSCAWFLPNQLQARTGTLWRTQQTKQRTVLLGYHCNVREFPVPPQGCL